MKYVYKKPEILSLDRFKKRFKLTLPTKVWKNDAWAGKYINEVWNPFNYHFKRLEVLKAKMKTVQKDKFDIRSWAKTTNKDELCGTTGCVLGHGCCVKEFNKRGLFLELELSGFDDDYNGKYKVSSTPIFETKSKKYDGFEAGEKFFGLTEKLSYYLFDPSYYPHKKRNIETVISRIDNLLNLELDDFLKAAKRIGHFYE